LLRGPARPLLGDRPTLILWRSSPLPRGGRRRRARLCGAALGWLRLRRLARPLLGDRPTLILWRISPLPRGVLRRFWRLPGLSGLIVELGTVHLRGRLGDVRHLRRRWLRLVLHGSLRLVGAVVVARLVGSGIVGD